MNLFDIVNDISFTKGRLITVENEKEYNSYFINRALSYFPECILSINQMNIHHFLDSMLQYDFLINSIRPAKRYSGKWPKKNIDDDLVVIQEYFGYSLDKARSALSILSKEQIKKIKERLEKGGG